MRTQFYNNRKQFFSSFLVALLIVMFGFYASTYADGQTAIIKVNKMTVGVIDNGWTGRFNYGGSWWPADFNCMGPSLENGQSHTGSGFHFAATNWTDPNGKLIDKVVLQNLDVYDKGDIVTQPLTNYVRWPLPVNFAKGVDVQVQHWGEPDATKMIGTCDQVAEVTTLNAMGVEVHRKIFAWSRQYHDNYIVCDVTLTNKSGKTLTDFYMRMHEAIFYMRRAYGENPDIPDNQQPTSEGWHHYYGAKPGDSLRIFYEYSADDPERAEDQMGYPVFSQDGRLVQSDIHFYTILHASINPYTDPANDIDDPLQPQVTNVYAPFAMGLASPNLGGSDASGRETIFDIITGETFKDQEISGQHSGTHHRANNDDQLNPDWTNLGQGFSKNSIWNHRCASFGPYTFNDGESVHIVYASGFADLGLKKAKEIGQKWLDKTLEDPPEIPNSETGFFPDNFAFPQDANEIDKKKDRWISTVIDSVHKSASRAKWNFEHDWQIPMAPPPTDQWVLGTGEGSEITWSNPEAEALQNFSGYRIMRRTGREDTVFFEQIHSTSADMKANDHLYIDKNVRFGASYFYYVQAGIKIDENDPNAHPDTRGKILWSGRMWSVTNTAVEPERPVGTYLDSIRIVPNPYNLKDPLWSEYGLTDLDDPRRIMFFNLPRKCTIKIFTENCDLVKTIEHTDFPIPTGYEQWDMLTESQQAIASGVYIVVFQTPAGEVSYQKLLVAR
jgi:hypothetical protein